MHMVVKTNTIILYVYTYVYRSTKKYIFIRVAKEASERWYVIIPICNHCDYD